MRHNNVLLCGVVDIPPKVVINEKTDEYDYAMGRVVTMRSSRSSGDENKNKLDCPLIYAHNPEVCHEMSSWQHGDLVLIKGVLATRNINKTRVCDKCGEKIRTPGIMTYVNPVYCKKLESFGDDTDAAKKRLKQVKEMSNGVTLLGLTCRDIRLFKKGGMTIASYQMAIMRKYRDRQDDESVKVDFPWVKSYANIADTDAKLLKKGTFILIDGFLQARTFKRKDSCPKCGNEFEWTDCSQELVPFAVEYLQNYVTEEELKEKAEQIYNAVFNKKTDEEAVISQEGVPENVDEIHAMFEKIKTVETETQTKSQEKIKLSDLI